MLYAIVMYAFKYSKLELLLFLKGYFSLSIIIIHRLMIILRLRFVSIQYLLLHFCVALPQFNSQPGASLSGIGLCRIPAEGLSGRIPNMPGAVNYFFKRNLYRMPKLIQRKFCNSNIASKRFCQMEAIMPRLTVRESYSAIRFKLSKIPFYCNHTGCQLTPAQGALIGKALIYERP